ncbi:hypothetical protein NCCP436_14350 [Pseudomonas sp. NCCP-436]|nr:hypothetical protein NCCP436_14350 [Pseudomonas sp. NCCP-436]
MLINDLLSGYGWLDHFPIATALTGSVATPDGAAPRIEPRLDVSASLHNNDCPVETGLRAVINSVDASQPSGLK